MSKPIALWCDCLTGKAPLTEALRQIAKGLGAEIVLLSRVSGKLDAEVGMLAADLHADSGAAPAASSFARLALGAGFDTAEPGSLWIGSDVDGETDPVLRKFQDRRELKGLAVIKLGQRETTTDFLEFHFAEPIQPGQRERLQTVAATVASTWQTRTPGVVSNALFRIRKTEVVPATHEHILSMENPARLSRTEYRVCLLLSQGNPVSEVKAELGICTSTLRTHLRSIYSKTNARNLGELMYQLLSVPD